MCGLVGIMSSNMMAKHRAALLDLLYLDTWRGRDSTGIAAIRSNMDTDLIKSTVPGYEFVENPRLDAFLKITDTVWIGHNRFGTIGKNIRTNAHPFIITDEDDACLLVGAHNGTLKNKWVLKDNQDFGTDSEALYHNIAWHGLEETMAKVEGAWALTYFDQFQEEMRFLRNEERPLYYAFSEDKKSLFWASEAWMLNIVCSRRDIKIDKPEMFKVDTLYTVANPIKSSETLELVEKGAVAGKPPVGFFPSQQERTGGTTGQDAQPQTATKTTETTSPRVSSSGTLSLPAGSNLNPTNSNSSRKLSGTNVTPIDIAKRYKGFAGISLSRHELEEQLSDGCAWCETHMIEPEDRFAWLAPGQPVCQYCLKGDHENHDEIMALISSDPVKNAGSVY